MNLPGNSIDVGTTRVPAPLFPGNPIPAYSSAPVATARLDAAFFADANSVRAGVQEWSTDELDGVAAVLREESARRTEAALVDVLRTLLRADDEQPPVRAEFVTDPNGGPGVVWSEETVYLHYADSTVDQFEEWPEEDDDPALVALDTRFRALLKAYSAHSRPAHNDHLIVDLSTGVFEHSGRHSA